MSGFVIFKYSTMWDHLMQFRTIIGKKRPTNNYSTYIEIENLTPFPKKYLNHNKIEHVRKN